MSCHNALKTEIKFRSYSLVSAAMFCHF